MAMSRYNRQNPFMFLLESKKDELTQKSEESIKYMIIMGIISAILIILHFINFVLINDSFVLFHFIINMAYPVFIIYINITIFLQVAKSVHSIKSDEINFMIFGDDYKDININNEKLLAQINEYNVSIGKVISITDMIKNLNVIFMITIAFYTVLVMIYIF